MLRSTSRVESSRFLYSIILRRSLLGWTQERIGEKFGLGRQTVTDIAGNFSSKLFGNIPSQFHEKSVNDLAEFYGLLLKT